MTRTFTTRLRFSENFPNGWEFLTTVSFTPMYARIYAKLRIFLFSITSNFEKVMPPKRDRFVIPALH